MALHIGQKEVARVLNLTQETVANFMRSSPSWRIDRGAQFYLTEVICWMPHKHFHRVNELVAASTDDQSLYAGIDGAMIARSFDCYISNDPVMRKRANRCQSNFLLNLGFYEGGSALAPYSDLLKLKILLWSGITSYVLTGNENGLPNKWEEFVVGFGIVNGGLDARELELIWELAS